MGMNFVRITSTGFERAGITSRTLRFQIMRESLARKLWSLQAGRRTLVCFSSNGRVSRTGKQCALCAEQTACLIKYRLYIYLDAAYYCLELPETSYQNYQRYGDHLRQRGSTVYNAITIAHVINRGYWGEVDFMPAHFPAISHPAGLRDIPLL